MAKVLMAWELGGGLGHVRRLLAVAEPLAAAGHEVTFVTKHVDGATNLLQEHAFPCYQAPKRVPGAARDAGFSAASYADILAISGFADRDQLRQSVAAWDALFDCLQPQLIVCDHSPTVCLAALGEFRVINLGSGFTIPPADGPEFPRLGAEAEPLVPQQQLLEVVQQVQRDRGRPIPQAITEIVSSTDRWVLSWPELDPYRKIRREPTWGPIERFCSPTPPPPGQRFFVYVSGQFAGIAAILTSLKQAGLEGEAYVRDATEPLKTSLRKIGLQIADRPRSSAAALAASSLLVHHGGLGMTHAALAAGRPQMVLPRHLEQHLTACSVEELGAGVQLKGRVHIDEIPRIAVRLMEPHRQQQMLELARQLNARQADVDVVGRIVEGSDGK